MPDRFPESTDRQVATGGAAWPLMVVFFIGQAVAQAASTVPYSLWSNYISDLGNTGCGPFALGTYHTVVCTPLSGVMNATFVVSGLLTLAGAVGTRRAWPKRRLTAVGLVLLGLAGAGQVLVGFRPENVDITLHGVGALFGIGGGDLGVVLVGPGGRRGGRPGDGRPLGGRRRGRPGRVRAAGQRAGPGPGHRPRRAGGGLSARRLADRRRRVPVLVGDVSWPAAGAGLRRTWSNCCARG